MVLPIICASILFIGIPLLKKKWFGLCFAIAGFLLFSANGLVAAVFVAVGAVLMIVIPRK